MADARFLHKKGMQGERVINLDHLQFRVWVQYVLSADDFGVMRASASVLLADNPKLEKEPLKKVLAAMSGVVASGLIQTFTHQGACFWWQTDWQDYQQVRYPRETPMPMPPICHLVKATDKTLKHFEIRRDQRRKDYVAVSEISPQPACAGGRETLTQTQAPTQTLTLTPTEVVILEESVDLVKPSRPDMSGITGYHHNCPDGTWAACARGFCVPTIVANEWRQSARAAGLDPEVEVRACVEDALLAAPGVLAGDKFKFWRTAWAMRHGDASASIAAPAPSNSATAHTMREARKALEEL